MDCLFCKIAAGEIPSNKVYEDELCFSFHDIAPQTPVHVLIIPKKHIASTNEINSDNSEYVSHIFEVIPKIASELGLSEGYRVITNCGENGCQSVKHLHFHILGGEKLSERMA
ncbi:MAG: histidine triad nucleotide-binding protein [Clostridia bacterium]|nr:histidine triad nucleotide-binding protein [Clostridia bacterium]